MPESRENCNGVARTELSCRNDSNSSGRFQIPAGVNFVTGRQSECGSRISPANDNSLFEYRRSDHQDNSQTRPPDARGRETTTPASFDGKSQLHQSCGKEVEFSSTSQDSSEDDNCVSKDTAASSVSKNKKKKDRSKLRKGKWSVEEEEYTSRIIHYFRTGLLTLPDGATLRSYLADKLNCDPMRVTKKYAGASCLGRRVYHHRDRISHQPPSVPDIQVARMELDLLENRFRARVEGGDGPLDNPSTMFSLSSMPSGQDFISQTMGLLAQQQQQQLQQQQAAAATAALLTAQQNLLQTNSNPLQALLLSLAVAAGSSQQQATSNSATNPIMGQLPVIAPAPQSIHMPSTLDTSWASHLASFAQVQAQALSNVTSSSQITSAASPAFPIVQQAQSFSNTSIPMPTNPTSMWSFPTSSGMGLQQPPLAKMPQQPTLNPNTTLDLLTKALGPTIAQAVAVASNLQKAEQQLQQHQQQQQSVAVKTPLCEQQQPHIQALAANFKQVEQNQKSNGEALTSKVFQVENRQANQNPSLMHASSANTGKLDQRQSDYQQVNRPQVIQQQNFPFQQMIQAAQLHTQPSAQPASAPVNIVMSQIQAYQLQLQQMYQQMQKQPTPSKMPSSNAQPQVSSLQQNASSAQQQSQINQNANQIPSSSTDQEANEFAIRLKEVYEQHLQKQHGVTKSAPAQPSSSIGSTSPGVSQHQSTPAPVMLTGNSQPAMKIKSDVNQQQVTSSTKSNGEVQGAVLASSKSNRVSIESTNAPVAVDAASAGGGNALVGFLSSLRQSYEEALQDQQQDQQQASTSRTSNHKRLDAPVDQSNASSKNEGITASRLAELAAFVALAAGNQGQDQVPNSNNRATATMITDSASSQNQVESSVEDYSDWNSDKKTDPSSSEDSDKELKESRSHNDKRYNNSGKGPPRKRMKLANN